MSSASAGTARLKRRVWISWEMHRRSQELSEALGASLHVVEPAQRGVLRYLRCLWESFRVLRSHRPELLFVQNPSLILAAFASLLKPAFGYRLVVDRHSNFYLGRLSRRDIGSRLLRGVSNFSLRAADLTIVTNDFLKGVVDDAGGRGFVLPDRIPTLRATAHQVLRGASNVVVICSFAPDEPIAAVVAAADRLPADVVLHLTGRLERARRFRSEWPKNITLTGYLEEQEFVNLLASCDVIVDLTTAEWCLLCGGYEAMALELPLVTSNTRALSTYFEKGAVLTGNTGEEIAFSIVRALDQRERLKEEMRDLRRIRAQQWADTYADLEVFLGA